MKENMSEVFANGMTRGDLRAAVNAASDTVDHAPVNCHTAELADAALDRRVALADAERAYDRAMVRAVADAAQATRNAEVAWSAACSKAKSAAATRRKMWAAHHAMSNPELVTVLRRHEFRLSAYNARFRTHASGQLSMWYVRMVRSELTRRGVL